MDNETQNIYIKFIQNCEMYKRIMGPSGLAVYNINDKIVFLFKDIHIEPVEKCITSCDIEKEKCVWINDLFNELFIASPFCIDFFMETISFLQIPKKIMTNQNQKNLLQLTINQFKINKKPEGLSKIYGTFADCLGPVKTGCEIYKRVRFHNIEYRRFSNSAYSFHSDTLRSIFEVPIYYMIKNYGRYRFKLSEIIKNDKNLFDVDNIKYDDNIKKFIVNVGKFELLLNDILMGNMVLFSKHIYEIYEFDLDDNTKKYIGNWKPLFTPEMLETESPYPKINKQLNVLPEAIKNKLVQYIFDRYESQVKPNIEHLHNAQKMLEEQILENNDMMIKIELFNIILWTYQITWNFSLLMFDTYSITRIMKSILIYQDSSMIFAYAGGNHINTFENIFAYLHNEGFIKLEHIAEFGNYNNIEILGDACIDLNNQQQEWSKIIEIFKTKLDKQEICTIKSGISIDSDL